MDKINQRLSIATVALATVQLVGAGIVFGLDFFAVLSAVLLICTTLWLTLIVDFGKGPHIAFGMVPVLVLLVTPLLPLVLGQVPQTEENAFLYLGRWVGLGIVPLFLSLPLMYWYMMQKRDLEDRKIGEEHFESDDIGPNRVTPMDLRAGYDDIARY